MKNDLKCRIIIISTKSIWIYNPYEFLAYEQKLDTLSESFVVDEIDTVLMGEKLFVISSIDNKETDSLDRIVLFSERAEILDTLNHTTTNLLDEVIPSPRSFNTQNSFLVLSDNTTFNGTHSDLTIFNYAIDGNSFSLLKQYELGYFPGAFGSITYIPPSKFAIAGEGYGYYIQYDIRLNEIEYSFQPSFISGTGDEGLINGSSRLIFDDKNGLLIWTLCTRIPHIDYGLMQFQYKWSEFNSMSKPFIEGNGGVRNTHRDVNFFSFIERDKPFDIVISGYNLDENRYDFTFNNNYTDRFEINIENNPIIIQKKFSDLLYNNLLFFQNESNYYYYSLHTRNVTKLEFNTCVYIPEKYFNDYNSILFPLKIIEGSFNKVPNISGQSWINDSTIGFSLFFVNQKEKLKIYYDTNIISQSNSFIILDPFKTINFSIREEMLIEYIEITVVSSDGTVWILSLQYGKIVNSIRFNHFLNELLKPVRLFFLILSIATTIIIILGLIQFLTNQVFIQKEDRIKSDEGSFSIDKSSTYCLLIGINKYNTFGQKDSIKPLKYAVNDAAKITELFLRKGVPNNNIKILIDDYNNDLIRNLSHVISISLTPENLKNLPLKANIQDYLDTLKHRPNIDTFIFFFGGHGVRNENKDYILPFDTSIKRIDERSISISDLMKEIEKIPAKLKIIILDACRVENTSRDITNFGNDLKNYDSENPILLILACRPHEKAHESDDFKMGIFSYYLMKGLEGDASEEIKIKLSDVESFIKQNVSQLSSSQFISEQNPHIRFMGEWSYSKKEIIFWEKDFR